MLPRLNKFARVPVCGIVAHYNDTAAPEGPDRAPGLMRHVLNKSLLIRGFIQDEFVRDHQRAFLTEATGWLAEGKLRYREDVTEGLENAPAAFNRMLRGQNFGKTVIKVS